MAILIDKEFETLERRSQDFEPTTLRRALIRSLGEGIGVELPDLNGVDLHGRLVGVRVVPSLVPSWLRVVEGIYCLRVGIGPRFAALAILEVSISAADSHVHDQEEVLVEGGVEVFLILPRVVASGKAAEIPEALRAGVHIEHNIVRGVEVGLNAILSPEEAINMEVISKRLGVSELLMSLLITIGIVVRTPVEGRGESIVATAACSAVIAS